MGLEKAEGECKVHSSYQRSVVVSNTVNNTLLANCQGLGTRQVGFAVVHEPLIFTF